MFLSHADLRLGGEHPIDDESDYELKVWASELPLRSVSGVPVPDPLLL